MKLPGGDEALEHATSLVFAAFQIVIAARERRPPTPWPDIPREMQLQWMAALRPAIEAMIAAMIHDQMLAISQYDGAMGGAYVRIVKRYAAEELNYSPAQPPTE